MQIQLGMGLHLWTLTLQIRYNSKEVRTLWASQVALVVKNLPAKAGDTRNVDSIPGVRKIPGRRKWQPTQVFLPGESHRLGSLVGYIP